MWKQDLRGFLEVLDQVENEEEEERLKADQQLAGKDKNKKNKKAPRKKRSVDKLIVGDKSKKQPKKNQKKDSLG